MIRSLGPPKCWFLALVACAPACGTGDSAAHAPVRAAVAGNFARTHEELARQFTAASGIDVETSLGSTGMLYAQISNGAPFDVFFAADTVRPHNLEQDGRVAPGTRFTYAVGRVAVYAPQMQTVPSSRDMLENASFQYVAIAHPVTAPYGAAARSVMTRWGLWERLESRIVRAENVAQAFQFVESGAAEIGFVPLALLRDQEAADYAIIPQDLHPPIRQDAVLLRSATENSAARAFLDFVRSAAGQRVISDFGYGLVD